MKAIFSHANKYLKFNYVWTPKISDGDVITFLKGRYYNYTDAWFPAWLASESPEDSTDKQNNY